METKPEPFVSEHNTRFSAARSSGPGGQRTNRRSTKVHVFARVDELPLSPEEKKLVGEKLAGRINQDGELEVSCEEERSQAANHAKALARMNELLEEAIVVPPPRIPTEPPHGAEIAAREHERKRYVKKRTRRESKKPNLAEEEENL